MIVIRIILLILLFLLGRRLYRSFVTRDRTVQDARAGRRAGSKDPAMEDLTDQDISDADFEEIP